MNQHSVNLNDLLRPTTCKECKGKLVYKSLGEYICENCGSIELDEYGKVRLFLEENGSMPAVAIAAATKVPVSIIDQYLREGKLEIPDGSPIYIRCEKCPTEIRYGRFCPNCAANLSKELKSVLVANEIGETPKTKPSSDSSRMRFLQDEVLTRRWNK